MSRVEGKCRLCCRQRELQYSHIIPRFVVKWLKETSLTGFISDLFSRTRQQEIRREYLLCSECEQVLGNDEREFCERIFVPYHERSEAVFHYEAWLRRFVIGLHWRVLAARTGSYPSGIARIYDSAIETWRRYILGESPEFGGFESHVFFADVIDSTTFRVPEKANWYLARGVDAAPGFNGVGEAIVYAKLVKIVTVTFLTPRDPNKEDWQGTLIVENGTLETPQRMSTTGFGAFLLDRIRLIQNIRSKVTPLQMAKLQKKIEACPEKLFSSESYKVFLADRALKNRSEGMHVQGRMKGASRNKPCPCGSGRKFKSCCGHRK